MALLAAGAAVANALVYRLILPLLVSQKLVLPPLLLWLAPFSLNLTAAAGLVSLSVSVIDLTRARSLADTSRRLLIAFLACIVLSTLVFATFLPEGRVNPQQVLVAAGALHTLNIQLAITAFRAVPSLACRTTLGLIGASSVFPLVSLLLRNLPSTQGMPLDGSASLHGLGELAYLLVPLAAAFVVVPWEDTQAERSARRAGAVAVAVMALAFAAAARLPDELYGHLLYSTLRLEWALERASIGYVVPVSLAVGAATSALVSRDQRHRQGGAGLWLWLAGGYNPLTPARILMTALAAMLLCRAALTLGQNRSSNPPPDP
ncbi:MAG: hypothetical protein QM778_12655 [Myxococcales bacterium]